MTTQAMTMMHMSMTSWKKQTEHMNMKTIYEMKTKFLNERLPIRIGTKVVYRGGFGRDARTVAGVVPSNKPTIQARSTGTKWMRCYTCKTTTYSHLTMVIGATLIRSMGWL